MRALFVNENIGGHTSLHQQWEPLLQRHPGLTVRFLHVPRPPSLFARVAGAPVPGLGRLDLDLQPLRAQLALSAWVRRRLPDGLVSSDVVHVYTENAALLSAGLLTAMPAVVSIDNTNALNAYRLPQREPTRWTPRHLKLTAFFERRVYAAASAIIAKSGWAAASLRDDYGVDDDRVRIIPPGILPPPVDPPAAPGTRTQTLPRIAFVGTSLARKGGSQLLSVHQRRLADRCELVLVTPERVPPARNVTVVSDIRPGDGRLLGLLRSCAVFALPSRIDAFSMAVLEAMAAGLPVVAAKAGGVPELVSDGVTGHLVPPGDDAALVTTLEALLSDPARRTAMGAAGRARVLARFDAHREVARLVDVLEEAIGRHRADPDAPRNRLARLSIRWRFRP